MAELSMVEGMILDMVAAGKSARAISEVTGYKPSEVMKIAYDLLDGEIITDIEQRRKLQVYRLEKMVEALWDRTMKGANKDDFKNLREALQDLNTLLALNKEQDAEQLQRMHDYQLAGYMRALQGLMLAFMALAPHLKTPEEWAEWTAGQVEEAKKAMMYEIEE